MAHKKGKVLKPANYFLISFLVVMSAITLFFANSLIKKTSIFNAGATAGQALLFFQPDAPKLPEQSQISLWASVDKPLVFSHLEFTFDPAKVKLASEVNVTNGDFSKVISVTSMAAANTSGRVAITVALDPARHLTAPSGTITFGTVTLQPVSTAYSTSTLNFDTVHSQLVDSSAIPYTLSATTGSLTLNPTPSPSTSPSPLRSPVPSASVAPSDTILPQVSIGSPANGAFVSRNVKTTILVDATDNIGVSKVDVLINGSRLCTVTAAPYTCSWTPKGKRNSRDTITAKAYDRANNIASVSITVTKK